MSLIGRIEQWNDARGYGFVRPLASQSDAQARAFVHVRAIERAGRRPADGDLVRYATARDAHGAPAYLGELPHASGGGPFAFGSSLAAVPGRVYLNDPGAGLRIIDISDPANVRLLACLKPVK